jgi:recombination protein RecT
MAAECHTHSLDYSLPAHGYVLGFASQAIAQLKAHRLKREAKVMAAMQALPHGTLETWVAHAYQDVPERLWPVAARSLQAHVDRIRSMPAGNN